MTNKQTSAQTSAQTMVKANPIPKEDIEKKVGVKRTKLTHDSALKLVYLNLTDNELNSLSSKDIEESAETTRLRKALKASILSDYNAARKDAAAKVLTKLAHVVAPAKKVDENLLLAEMYTDKSGVTAICDTDDRLATLLMTAVNTRISACIEKPATETTVDVKRLVKMYNAFGANSEALSGCSKFFGISEESAQKLLDSAK